MYPILSTACRFTGLGTCSSQASPQTSPPCSKKLLVLLLLERPEELEDVYGTGTDRLAPFGDMLVVHELAHAFHDGLPFLFPRSWLMELFADMSLYVFVVTNEPDRIADLETLPRVVLDNNLVTLVARDLRYFEAFYPDIEPLTYVWYQFRFTMMAKVVVDATGPSVLRRLWETFALSDEQLAAVLGGRVNPTAGRWLTSWSELEGES